MAESLNPNLTIYPALLDKGLVQAARQDVLDMVDRRYEEPFISNAGAWEIAGSMYYAVLARSSPRQPDRAAISENTAEFGYTALCEVIAIVEDKMRVNDRPLGFLIGVSPAGVDLPIHADPYHDRSYVTGLSGTVEATVGDYVFTHRPGTTYSFDRADIAGRRVAHGFTNGDSERIALLQRQFH